MKSFKLLSLAVLAALVFVPFISSAEVIPPALDIQDQPGDAGASITSSTFDIDATALGIALPGGGFIALPDPAFTLNSTGSFDGSLGTFSGSFIVDGGLLSGDFASLAVLNVGDGFQFSADVSFTGGSLVGPATGRIEGTTFGSAVIAKVGPVVPVPAAVWLFGSGLLGLVAIARRNKPLPQ